jgi:membrane protein YdbS with pleckstrin-like domain
MYEPLRRRVLALLKVPPEPHPPMGDPASLRVFRAGRNYFKLRLARWSVAQILALAGILFWAAFLIEVETMVSAGKPTRAAQPAAIVVPAEPGKSAGPVSTPSDTNQRREKWADGFANNVKSAVAAAGPKNKGWVAFKQFFVEIALVLPAWTFPLIWGLKIFGFVIYLLQIPITYAVRRLDYEMRWYLVTDRSLRLRSGVWKISESTMSFANLQQVVVTQGPLQRLLGLADVKVQSAGGGSGGQSDPEGHDDMHLGSFHSVTNAPEIRDLILERLRRFRESGLGDPDEKLTSTSPVAPTTAASADTIAAAQELLAEAKALRVALE